MPKFIKMEDLVNAAKAGDKIILTGEGRGKFPEFIHKHEPMTIQHGAVKFNKQCALPTGIYWRSDAKTSEDFQGLIPEDDGTNQPMEVSEYGLSGVMPQVYQEAWVAKRTSEKRNALGRLHNSEGPAITWEDGSAEYFLNGIRIKAEWFVDNKLKDAKAISDERNAEVRRVLIENYGAVQWAIDSGATLVHEDDWGKLYRKTRGSWERPLEFVKVVNSTPEPDGSFKDYFIRVEPGAKTACEAVASTFRIAGRKLTKEEYISLQQQT